MSKLIKDIIEQETFKSFTENTINEGVEMYFVRTNENKLYKLTKENNVFRISTTITGKGRVITEEKYKYVLNHILKNK